MLFIKYVSMIYMFTRSVKTYGIALISNNYVYDLWVLYDLKWPWRFTVEKATV